MSTHVPIASSLLSPAVLTVTLALASLVLLSSCATITTTTREEIQVLSSQVHEQRSPDWTYTAVAHGRQTDPATAAVFSVEVEVTQAHTCAQQTVRSLRHVTLIDREYKNPAEPVGEWLVGVLGTTAAVVLFAVAPPALRDPMTDELPFTPTGVAGLGVGFWGLAGLTVAIVDLVRVRDRSEAGEPETEVRESDPVECDSGPSRNTKIEVLAVPSATGPRDGQVVARATTDENGVAVVEVSRDVLAQDGDSLRLRVAGGEARAFHALDDEYAELRRIAQAEATRLAAERATREAAQAAATERRARSCARLCTAGNGGDFDAFDSEPRVLDWLHSAYEATRGACRPRSSRACEQLLGTECARLCVHAPEVDPSATIPSRAAGSPATATEVLAALRTVGIAGFRLGARESEIRGACAALHGTIDASALASHDQLGCDGRFTASVMGQTLPAIRDATITFCGGTACKIRLAASNSTDAGRGGVLAYRDALSAIFTSIFGAPVNSGSGDGVEGTRTWQDGRRIGITVTFMVPRATRDMRFAIIMADVMSVEFSVGAALHAAPARRPR